MMVNLLKKIMAEVEVEEIIKIRAKKKKNINVGCGGVATTQGLRGNHNTHVSRKRELLN